MSAWSSVVPLRPRGSSLVGHLPGASAPLPSSAEVSFILNSFFSKKWLFNETITLKINPNVCFIKKYYLKFFPVNVLQLCIYLLKIT